MGTNRELTMLDLFDGRRDCFFDSYKLGLYYSADSGPHHESVRNASDMGWLVAFSTHELGFTDIGVYPRRDDGLCKWGCVDIDTGDLSEALEVHSGLADAGVGAWVEASGSWKDLNKRGYHVWVFVDDWVNAAAMRALLVEVVRHAGLPEQTEINPKQIAATKKGVGNCVRLPYGKRSLEHPGYSCMTLSPGVEFKDFSRDEFLAEVEPTSRALIEALGGAALHRQNLRKSTYDALERLRRHEEFVPPFVPGTGGKGGGHNQRAWKILHGLDRANDGERNLCAFVIACHLKGLNKSHDQAKAEMTVAVERSFHDGAHFVDEALEVLAKVYR